MKKDQRQKIIEIFEKFLNHHANIFLYLKSHILLNQFKGMLYGKS